MGRVPARFGRVAAAFQEATMTADSSGSDHSPEGFSADLSDLVNSFIERDCFFAAGSDEAAAVEPEKGCEDTLQGCDLSESDVKDSLESLFATGENVSGKRKEILAATEIIRRNLGDRSSPEFKRRLMSRLRDKGFDAGLCKSRWEKFGRHPAGSYEYVDVNADGTRYIVEVNLAGEFEIARPTAGYTSSLEAFPAVFVGKLEELKQITRLMCTAIRRSMRTTGMHVPPWRRNGYMQAKWSGPYKRTTNETATAKGGSSPDEKKKTQLWVGFKPQGKQISVYNCRDGGRDVGVKIGNLSAAFNSRKEVGVQNG